LWLWLRIFVPRLVIREWVGCLVVWHVAFASHTTGCVQPFYLAFCLARGTDLPTHVKWVGVNAGSSISAQTRSARDLVEEVTEGVKVGVSEGTSRPS
jgi:hypothetical protein